MKKNISVVILFLVALLAISVVSALPVTIDHVEVDGTVLGDSGTGHIYAKEKNDQIEVKVVLTAQSDLKDVQIEAALRGYDYPDLIDDITDAFDMKANVTYQKKLTLTLPIRMDKDSYKLRVRVEDKDGVTTEQTYELQVEADNHLLYIRDIVFNPENFVKTGRALLTTVRLKNVGEQTEDGVKVKVSIPALGVSASDYIDEIEEEESTTSEELYMRIPECAEPGEYDVKVEISYHDGEEKETKAGTITVVEGDVCPNNSVPSDEPNGVEKTVISVGAGSQKLVAGGAGAVYPITITNQGSRTRTYSLDVDVPGAWATTQVTPSNVAIVSAGDSATFYVSLAAKGDAAVGENMFSLTVNSGGETLKQIPLKATVSKSTASGLDWTKVKQALTIALVILVVLLVIIGLVIGFNKLKGSNEEESEEEMGKTYY
jgi:hypothetical protein